MSTIRLAEQFQAASPDLRFVPIFWMATEDHDFEEINHCYVGPEEKVVYPGKFTSAVGRHVIEGGIAETFPELVPAELRAHYAAGSLLTDAYRTLIHDLFGQHGLVIIDADHPALKRAFLPALRRELQGDGMQADISSTNAALEAAGYKNPDPRPRDQSFLSAGQRAPSHPTR